VIYTSGFFFLTIAFALIAIIAVTLRFSERTQVLKVAVGPADSDNAKLIEAIARHLERDGGRIRFVILPVDDLAQSAKALEQGRADLAVIRSDIAIPRNGATVVILHNDIAVLAAPAGSTITKASALLKKRVDCSSNGLDATLLDAILAAYGIDPGTVQHIMLSGDDLVTIVSQKGSMRYSLSARYAAARSKSRWPPWRLEIAPRFNPVDAAEGMAARGPEYQKADIPAGFIRGSPPQPKEDVATISIAVRLEARQNLSEEVVTRLTKRLFAMRRSLQSEVPVAAAMENQTPRRAPPTPFTRVRQPITKQRKELYGSVWRLALHQRHGFSGLGSVIAAMFG